MTICKTTSVICAAFIFISCHSNQAVQVGDNTFVEDDKVYKVLNNEVVLLANLNSNAIRKLNVLEPKLRSLGKDSLPFIKEGAYAILDVMYRGNTLYYKLQILGLNDLKEQYTYGRFTIELMDDQGFIIQEPVVSTDSLIGIVDTSGKIESFSYKGKVDISTEMNDAITYYQVSSTIRKKGL